jgi:hypothetical protein
MLVGDGPGALMPTSTHLLLRGQQVDDHLVRSVAEFELADGQRRGVGGCPGLHQGQKMRHHIM